MRVFRRTDNGHRGRTYWIEYRRGGRRYRRSLRVRDRFTAERLARRYLDEIDARGLGVLTVERKTVRELLPLYESELLRRACAPSYMSRLLRRLERFLPLERPVAEITPHALTETLQVVPGGPRSKAHAFDAFRSFFAWCERLSHVLRSPMSRLVKGRVPRTREQRRSLAVEQLSRLLKVSPWHRGVFYFFLAFTGLRTVEARRVEWRDLDAARKVLVIREEVAKARKGEVLPIRRDLWLWLQRWREVATGERVFGRSPTRETFYRDLGKAGISRVNAEGRIDYHALRVTFVTLLGESGASSATQQALARHDTSAMTTMYTRFGDQHLRAAVEGIPGAFPFPENPPRLPPKGEDAA